MIDMYYYIYYINIYISSILKETVVYGRKSLINSKNLKAVQRILLKHFHQVYENDGDMRLDCFKVAVVDKLTYEYESREFITLKKQQAAPELLQKQNS